MPQVDGSWAIAVSDQRRQGIFLARNAASPMQLTHERKRKVLWFASTTSILSQGLGHEVKAQPGSLGPKIAELRAYFQKNISAVRDIALF